MSTSTVHGAMQRRSPEARRAIIIENVEFLASWGTSFNEIARRVGKTPLALYRSLYRWGRPDLAQLAHGGGRKL